ncbi:calcium-binding protein [Asticcacaulis sp. AC402]|uniref:calcium-binding protein n=1 Tax=Asticcacaulis sp. AC402 TaxID=1282361 RepID=UPI0003C3ED28|nr:calcium-binding protein [Asticcacaulis sp. AC402]ESQ75151.1 hemolysin E [Asticcacaulis sp. AC402]
MASRGSSTSVIAAIWTGGPGNDSYVGGGSGDTIEGREGDDLLDGGGGQDSIAGEGGNDQIYGETGSDTLNGGEGDDMVWGGTGHDVLNGGFGDDSLTGGTGNDTYVVNAVGDVIDEQSGQGTDVVQASITFSLAGTHLEHLVLIGIANINGTGSASANSLTGNNSSNLLDGGDGSDTMMGAAGWDTYIVNSASDIVIEVVGQGDDLVRAGVSYTLSDHVERMTLTGTGDINATGNSSHNQLIGNSGNNVLDGATGGDYMTGGLGNDTYYIDETGDRIFELAGEGTDLAYASVSYVLVGTVVENLILTGTADLNATGNGVGNRLTGNSGNNVLDGLVGNDTLTGGLGDDTYYVQSSGDKVVEASGEGYDVVYASATYTLTGRHAEELWLTGSADIDASGNGVSNVLVGNGGANVLNGLGGNDTLTGGLGADSFLFGVASRADTVTDFSAVEGDMIDVNAYTNGVANEGLVTQVGLNVVIDFGSGNVVTVLNAAQVDVLSHIVW